MIRLDNLFLNKFKLVRKCCRANKCLVTCEVCVCVVVYIVTVYFCTLFSGTADRLAQ